MNPTKAFLLNEMANAASLEEFFLAHRAIVRLNQLAAERGLAMQQPLGVPQQDSRMNELATQRQQFYQQPMDQQRAPRTFRDSDVAPDFDQMGGGVMPFDL